MHLNHSVAISQHHAKYISTVCLRIISFCINVKKLFASKQTVTYKLPFQHIKNKCPGPYN